MGNGPFREPEAPQSTVPTGRARYGGVSPLLQNPGDGNKTKDPYFTPPKELPKKSPFAEPPSIKKESPSLQPDDSKVKFNPKINHKWTDTSPKNGFANSENRSEALAELDEAFGSQALKLLQAKQRQTGSITARGIIAGAGTGALSEPIGKLARLGINALDNAPEGTIRNYVGSRLSRHFTERGSLAAEMLAEEKTMRAARSSWERIAKLDESILDKIDRKINPSLWSSEEKLHKVNVMRSLGVSENDLPEILRQRGFAMESNSDAQLLYKIQNRIDLTTKERSYLLRLSKERGIHDIATRQLGVRHADALVDGTFEQLLKDRIQLGQSTRSASLYEQGAGKVLGKINELEHCFNQRLFSQAEKGLLEHHELASSRISTLEQARLKTLVSGKDPWYSSASIDNMKKGALYAVGTAALLKADESIRDKIKEKSAMFSNSWESSSLSVPISLALAGTRAKNPQGALVSKAAAGAAAVGAGYLIDYLFPDAPEAMKELHPFTAYDGIAQGIAFSMAVPSKSKLVRAGVIAAGVGLGKIADQLASGSTTGSVQERAFDAVASDKVKRSFESLENAVDKLKELGAKNEVVLQATFTDLHLEMQKNWNAVDPGTKKPFMSQADKLKAVRAMVSVAKAYGEYRLEQGARLSPKAVSEPSYILGALKPSGTPMNLDLGGEALNYLRMAAANVQAAKRYTATLMKTEELVEGKKVTSDELDGLQAEEVKIKASINAIYGKHDIVAAFDQLKQFKGTGATTRGVTLNNELAYSITFEQELDKMMARNWNTTTYTDGSKNEDGERFIAKLIRDRALVGLATAGLKLDRGSDAEGAAKAIWGTDEGRQTVWPGLTDKNGNPRPKGFDGAIDMLMMAERLDPDNADLPELWALGARLAEQTKIQAPDQEKFDILRARARRR